MRLSLILCGVTPTNTHGALVVADVGDAIADEEAEADKDE